MANLITMPPLTRPLYFDGRLLTSAEFQLEQQYTVERGRRHNRLVHGNGVVSGLTVTTTSKLKLPTIQIAPGAAIDAVGNEMELAAPVSLRLAMPGTAFYVAIRYVERESGPMPAATADASGSFVRNTLIEESCEVALIASPDPKTEVMLARFVKANGSWAMDGTFKAKRLG